MNPSVLFDKSVFQETPASASVAADRYLEIVIPPILVREIGGDLAVSSGKRKVRDQRAFVAKLAIRAGTRAFVSHHAPIMHHDLVGCPVPMDGRTPVMMRPVPRPDDPTGLAAIETPEEYALNRWRQGAD